jgi:superfamily II RNA helicase
MPKDPSADAILDRFMEWVSSSGLSLYPHQEEAILELLGGKHVVLATPTGSGKSMVAFALHFIARSRGETSFYTCPIKALVNEKFFALCEAFGAENVGLMTGDAAVNRGAPIICCTAEILMNLALREGRRFADWVVMDEFHFYGDKERGVAWQVPLLTLPETTFLLMSATLGDVTSITTPLVELTKREVAEVRSATRPVPLEFSYAETPLHETVQKLLEGNRAPVYLVNFTQRSAAEQAQNLLSIDFLTKPQKEQLKDATAGARFDTPFGKDLKRLLLHGVGLHHAGLLPKYRRVVERLAQDGLLKVISGTDTLGVGVNIPIRTVLLTQLCKFDGEKTGLLSVRDFQQISGRAGRKGFDDLGYVVAQAPAHVIENLALSQKKAAGKKVVMQKPPTKGYVHWDASTFEKLQTKAPEPLESRFTLSHGLIVNLLQAHADASVGGYRRLVELIGKHHGHAGAKVRLYKQARMLLRSLLTAGLVVHEKRTPTMPAHLVLQAGLQHDFSLHHTLSLFMLDGLGKLEKELEGYGLHVLSLVESILESPDVILYSQLDKLKGEKVAEMKAAGIEYEQRMEELEKLTHPKPDADFIYATFNAFAAKHPWVGQEDVRPKSIARELFETCMTFNDYVREYGLQRSEGVLLRYLSEAYKTLATNVPEAARDEGVEDILAFLLTTLKQVDASLLEEWQSMKEQRAELRQQPAKPRPDLGANPKLLMARVRSELHRLTAALSRKNYEDAAEMLPSGSGWTGERVEAELKPFWDAGLKIDTTPRARQPVLTTMTSDEPRVWTVRHELVDTEWMLEGQVDLRGREDSDEALFELRRIGE